VRALKLYLFILFCIPFYSNSANAIDLVYTECSTCKTTSEFTIAANYKGVVGKNILVNVMNFANYEMRKFNVYKTTHIECEYDTEPDGYGESLQICRRKNYYSTVEQQIPSGEFSDFYDLADAVNYSKKFVASYSITVPKDVVETGWQLIGTTYMQTRVLDYFTNSPIQKDFAVKSLTILTSASKIVKTSIQFEMPAMVFVFSDGSKVYVTAQSYDLDDNVHFKFEKLVDVDGNVVKMDKLNPFTDQKVFSFVNSLSAYKAFLNILGAYSLTITNLTPLPSGQVIVTVCDSSKVCLHPE
jgi:hypothetical protein